MREQEISQKLHRGCIYDEWISHSNFSFLYGASHPEELVERAFHLGYRSLCLTDFDGVYGAVRAQRAQNNLRKEYERVYQSEFAFSLRFGVEVHLNNDHDQELWQQQTLVLIATRLPVYQEICRIITRSHERGGKRTAHLHLDDLTILANIDGAVVIQPMRGKAYFNQDLSYLRDLKDRFSTRKGSRLFLAITDRRTASDEVLIPQVLQAAGYLGLPLLYSQDVFMHDPARVICADLLQAIRSNRTLDEVSSRLFINSQSALHERQALGNRMRHWGCWASFHKSSQEIYSLCDFDLSQLRYHYPQENLPPGMTVEVYLENLVWQGAHKRYGERIPAAVIELIKKELVLVKELGFCDYFLTVWDIVHWAVSREILCQGRGSAANSVLCYVLGITSVDPDRFDVLFERFLSRERGDPPDIDVDFEHERREEVIQYIYDRYGRGRAGMVCNIIQFRTRGALRAVGKALGISARAIDECARLVSEREIRRDIPGLIQLCYKNLQGQGLTKLQMQWWEELVLMLKGFPRHLGIHSGGFVISQKDLSTFVPQEPATMEGRSVIQWNKEDIEYLGFFKIDILALGMLTAVRKCLSLIHQSRGVDLSLDKIPQDDAKTFEMIGRAETVGTFQIESRAQISMLPRLRPKCLYDLVVQVAIIRPGPIQGGLIHPYLKRRHGQEKITYPHPSTEGILKRTLGIPLFQEQVMRIAIEIGDFTPGEADQLRKKIGAWQIQDNLDPWIQKFIVGMKNHGIEPSLMQQLCEQLKAFAHYGFPESHAISFAFIAYASSYLKCHYPEEFYVSICNSQPMGFYSPHSLMFDARRQGIPVLPVCVLRSDGDYKIERTPSGQKQIRVGFRSIKSLREQTVQKIIENRSKIVNHMDLTCWVEICQLTRAEVGVLAAADAFSALGFTRRKAYWIAEALPFAADDFLPLTLDREANASWLSEGHEHLRDESPLERMYSDLQSLETTREDHPIKTMKAGFWPYTFPLEKIVTSKALAFIPARRIVTVFGMLIIRQSPPTAKGMVFLTLEDEEGFLNIVIRPDIHQKHAMQIQRQLFFCIQGELQRSSSPARLKNTREQPSAYSILAHKIF